ncbi:MAG: GNAT family N-acetyltransferase [Algicola sp.]|nr:GNAT family N-acetyltransferase [Algicola sp.]
MKLLLLADEPSAAATVATWYFNEWCKDTGRYDKDEVEKKVYASTNRDKPPLLVLAKEDDTLIGAAELKFREMDIYPQFEHWIGGVYVDENHRGKGVAFKLVSEVIAKARSVGVKKLYLQTEDLSGGLYARMGFKPIEEADSNGVKVLVMVADIQCIRH